MKKFGVSLALTLIASTIAIPVSAQTPTIDQSLSLKSAANPRIVPVRIKVR